MNSTQFAESLYERIRAEPDLTALAAGSGVPEMILRGIAGDQLSVSRLSLTDREGLASHWGLTVERDR